MPTQYEASGPGAAFLPYPALQFLLTTDPFLGTTLQGVPEGPFNRELHKLLQNDSALANLFESYLSRTFGSTVDAAPAVDTVPEPLAGASSTPSDRSTHTVFYSNSEVVYRYNGTDGVWEEVTRMARTFSVFTRYYRKVTVLLEDGEDNISIPLPTETDDLVTFAFTLDHLKTFYVNNLDEASPLVSVLPGINVGASVLRVVVSTPPLVGSDYELVLVFEHIDIS